MSEELAWSSENDMANEAQEPDAPAESKSRTDWKAELRGIAWLILAVLGFHSFIAKPFYIPSESMLPGLRVGDQLVVSKFAYGWSFVSPTIPNPVAVVRSLFRHQPADQASGGNAREDESWGFQLPHVSGRLFGSLPERGDIVIVTPPGRNTDYIKRVIGLPGDRLQIVGGVVILNGVAIKRGPVHDVLIPVDGNTKCNPVDYNGALVTGADGKPYCKLPLVTETLPSGRTYDTVDFEPGYSDGDNKGPYLVPPDHVFLMGDNRDRSADSRFSLDQQGLGGPVPWEYIGGRAEFITFSKSDNGSWNPLTIGQWFRGGRAGTSLRPQGGK